MGVGYPGWCGRRETARSALDAARAAGDAKVRAEIDARLGDAEWAKLAYEERCERARAFRASCRDRVAAAGEPARPEDEDPDVE